jgi:hypothetical protein
MRKLWARKSSKVLWTLLSCVWLHWSYLTSSTCIQMVWMLGGLVSSCLTTFELSLTALVSRRRGICSEVVHLFKKQNGRLLLLGNRGSSITSVRCKAAFKRAPVPSRAWLRCHQSWRSSGECQAIAAHPTPALCPSRLGFPSLLRLFRVCLQAVISSECME